MTEAVEQSVADTPFLEDTDFFTLISIPMKGLVAKITAGFGAAITLIFGIDVLKKAADPYSRIPAIIQMVLTGSSYGLSLI